VFLSEMEAAKNELRDDLSWPSVPSPGPPVAPVCMGGCMTRGRCMQARAGRCATCATRTGPQNFI
jgi:hypothetical protein